MSGIINSCSHLYEIIDQREGNIICEECGLVIDRYYTFKFQRENFDQIENISSFEKDFVYETLERLNLPKSFSSYIFKNISLNNYKRKKSESLLSGIIYKTLIELKIPFTLNDISGVTGINTKKIFKDEKKKEELKNIVIIDSSEILERVCSKLNLTFSDYTLIKENIKKSNNGFNPSTVISAHIYIYCKDKKIKILMKDICDITGISCMSIKRYIKKNVSS
jgi:transcription initiation factor TFIIIB Brf1 subunit/transcription initiation factor TFIIB